MTMNKPQPEGGNFEASFAHWLEGCLAVENLDSKKEEFRDEAQTLFRSIVSDEELGAAPAFLDTCLAKLLQTLGPGLTGRFRSRICSLSVICGAVEGCRKSELTIRTSSLLSKFLLQQCSPIAEEGESFGEDYAEQIRDLAVKCLSALLLCQLQTNGDVALLIEACQLIFTTARQGVELRCALPMEDEDARHLSGVTGGLSTLPRSRRSNCFLLVQSAVDGIESLIAQNQPQLERMAELSETDMIAFIRFACSCLLGESDPRCLMQLLVLFHKVQVCFLPLFHSGKLPSFPSVAMFDAVAPYYPINFTPPPHNNHGITRDGLKGALMAVLSFSSYDSLAATENEDTMLSLSLGLVLERLIPMDGDTSNLAGNAVEKHDALDDMELILFPGSDRSALDLLPKGSAQQLSNALIITHQDAAVAVTMGGAGVDDNKKLADSCRLLVAKIAARVESVREKSHWNDFVRDPVTDMVSQLESTNGRVAIAYLASLVASGGPQTTRFVLDAGLAKSVHGLKQYKTDEELATMAAYGIGAFFSSCRVAWDKAQQSGLHWHPHPVAKMSSETFQILYKVWTDSETKESYSLRNAVVVALEAVLIISPADLFNESDQASIAEYVSQLASDVLEATDEHDSIHDKHKLNLATAGANALGGLMGKAVQTDVATNGQDESTINDTILMSKQVQEVLKSKVMVDLLFKAKQNSPLDGRGRFDRIALSRACVTGLPSATIIIESLLHALWDAITAHSVSQSLDAAVALSYILKNGGDLATRAFHELPPTGITAKDVIDKLCDLDPRRERTKGDAQDKVVSPLDLPPTVEELQQVQKVRQEIAFLLLPAYKVWVPTEIVLNLMSSVATIMPPLSSQDVLRLAVMLPLLAEALENGNLPSREQLGESKTVIVAANDLATYTLNCDYDSTSRSAAADCLYSFIAHLAISDEQACPAKQVLEDVVMPSLMDATSNPDQKASTGATERVLDCLQLSSILASAAASRGGASIATADIVSAFLVQLACNLNAQVPFIGSDYIASAAVASSAAAAFGSLLCNKRALWTQRLTHKTLKLLEPTLQQVHDGKVKPNVDILGFIAVLCHLVCAGSLKSASLSTRGTVVKLIADSLVSGMFIKADSFSIPHELDEVKRLVVASILKLSQNSPGLLASHTESLVVGLMRVYANAADSDPFSDIPCKLLILQVMERFCHIEIRKKSLHAVQPAITSVLAAAMNHPSRLLREAAVTVQNTWCTLPE